MLNLTFHGIGSNSISLHSALGSKKIRFSHICRAMEGNSNWINRRNSV